MKNRITESNTNKSYSFGKISDGTPDGYYSVLKDGKPIGIAVDTKDQGERFVKEQQEKEITNTL